MKRKTQFAFGKMKSIFHITPSLYIDWPISKHQNGFAIQIIWLVWAVGVRIYKR